MVQTVLAPDDLNSEFETMWKKVSPEQLMDTKLKCVFEMPAEQNEVQEQQEPPLKTSPKAPVQASAPPATNLIETELQKAAAEVREQSFLLVTKC